MNKEKKASKEYRVTAKQTRHYETLVWAESEDEAWEKAMARPHLFEECLTRNDWEKVEIEQE